MRADKGSKNTGSLMVAVLFPEDTAMRNFRKVWSRHLNRTDRGKWDSRDPSLRPIPSWWD